MIKKTPKQTNKQTNKQKNQCKKYRAKDAALGKGTTDSDTIKYFNVNDNCTCCNGQKGSNKHDDTSSNVI